MIKNKVLALICAVSMIGAMFTTVVSAANPDIKLTLAVEKCDFELDDNLDEDLNFEDYYGAPVYKLSMSISGLAKKASVKENGTTVAYTGTMMGALGAFIDFDADKFTYVKGESTFGGTFVPGKVAGADQLSITWYDSSNKKEDGVVGSLYLFANSGEEVTEEAPFTLDATKSYVYAEYYDGTSKTPARTTDVETNASNGLSFVNVTLNEVLTQKYNVSVGTVENGTVTLDATGEVEENTVVNVTATANEGYELSAILVNGEAIDGTSFVVTEDAVVTATFEKVVVIVPATYELVGKADNNAAGKIAYTQGFKYSVVGNGEVVTGVNFKFTDGTKTSEEKTGFTNLKITGETPFTLGLNVINVPAGTTIDVADVKLVK